MHTTWIKHDGSIESPVEATAVIEVETYTSNPNIIAKASELNWKAIKFYRIANTEVKEAAPVEESIQPVKVFMVITAAEGCTVEGYQAACQKATQLFKAGEEPTIIIRYFKPSEVITKIV